MTYQISTPPWPHKNSSARLSGDSFRNKASSYLKNFNKVHKELQSIFEMFKSQVELLPDDCDSAVENIQSLQLSLNQLHQFLDTSEHLPMSVVPMRYGMVFSIHHLDDLTYQLLPLLHAYRRECLEINTNTLRMQRQIVENLERILDVANQIELQAHLLLGKK